MQKEFLDAIFDKKLTWIRKMNWLVCWDYVLVFKVSPWFMEIGKSSRVLDLIAFISDSIWDKMH